MADEVIETIEDAIESVAKGMVSSSEESGRKIDRLSVKDMITADQYLAGKAASAKAHFGVRFTKCIPPGGG
tara:strand:+ start:228 stop:440 length:213 start_codon:yes stop_codon:yes gene_type:complete